MRKSIKSAAPLILIDIDILPKICSLLQEDGFLDLFFLIQVWFPFQTPETVNKILNNLDWSRVHEVVEPFKNLECRVFNKFVDHCVKIGVKGGLYYYACWKLIRGKNPTHHLQVLRVISNDDNLSFLAYYVFQSLYDPSTLKHNSILLHQKLSTDSDFRSDFINNCTTLNGRYRKYNRTFGRPDFFPKMVSVHYTFQV
ncbi:hypothetical protein DCAR_0934490 [Daucus carota subsp. sativus]|uniref:Uncharacterized protein n=1 Tax=Daucus carota subsp. sativus TaxID=79200 RepID=A0A175YFJ7_DAUCS|nr:hypothetical protein DCAR_0934490 [Daucus carota subsp. sativus]